MLNLHQLAKFAKHNGYLIAHYVLDDHDNNYNLKTLDLMDYDDIQLETRPMLAGMTDYKVTKTTNNHDFFVLHNTYNLPNRQDAKNLLF